MNNIQKGLYHMNSENYGTHIKHIRQKMGLTQNQVAEALGVTPGYISNVENNRTAMSLRILTYYAKLCGCSLGFLWIRNIQKLRLIVSFIMRLCSLMWIRKKNY